MKENWTIEIKPKKRLLDIDLKGIWRYRDLYRMYVKRDIVTVYKQTILGPLWFLIQPIFTTVMYMFVFGGLAGISTDGAPQPLFYMAGIMLWNYFNAAFSVSSNVFTANASVFGKVYFPRLVVPLAGITSNLIKFGIQLLLFIAMYIYYYAIGANLSINWTLLLFPFLVFLIAFHASHEVMGLDATILASLIFSFKLVLSLSSSTLIKRLFSSSLLSAIRVISSIYLRLLMFLPPILIPACNSSNPAFLMLCSVYGLNKQGDSR